MESTFNRYIEIQKEIYEYFGYVENWRILPLVFDLDMYWAEDGDTVHFSENKEYLTDIELAGNGYSNEIYRQRHLPKHVYRAKDYTMIVVDTHTDGNKFLQVFDNSKEIKGHIAAFDY